MAYAPPEAHTYTEPDPAYPVGSRICIEFRSLPADVVWGTVVSVEEWVKEMGYKKAFGGSCCYPYILARWDDDDKLNHCESNSVIQHELALYSICAECDGPVMERHYLCSECRVLA